jgi:hypothetical protein
MFRTLSLSLLLACSCGLANAQDGNVNDGVPPPDISVDDGGLSGTLVTFFGGDPSVDQTTVFTIPQGSVLALTTMCVFGPERIVGGLPVPRVFSNFDIAQGAGCVNYSPGLVVGGPGTTLVCVQGACNGSGILFDCPPNAGGGCP